MCVVVFRVNSRIVDKTQTMSDNTEVMGMMQAMWDSINQKLDGINDRLEAHSVAIDMLKSKGNPVTSSEPSTPVQLQNVPPATDYRTYPERRASNTFAQDREKSYASSQSKVFLQTERKPTDYPKLTTPTITVKSTLFLTGKLREDMNSDGNVDYYPGYRCLSEAHRVALRASAKLRDQFTTLKNDNCWSVIQAQELLDILQHYVAVESTTDFANALAENAKFRLEDVSAAFSIDKFPAYYEAVAQYSLRFREVMSFLSSPKHPDGGNIGDYYTPPLNYDEGGLYRIFLDSFVPSGVGKIIWIQLPAA